MTGARATGMEMMKSPKGSGFRTFLRKIWNYAKIPNMERNPNISTKIALSVPPSPKHYRTHRLLILLGAEIAKSAF